MSWGGGNHLKHVPFPIESEGKGKSPFPSSQLILDFGTLTDRRIRRQKTFPHILGNPGSYVSREITLRLLLMGQFYMGNTATFMLILTL